MKTIDELLSEVSKKINVPAKVSEPVKAKENRTEINKSVKEEKKQPSDNIKPQKAGVKSYEKLTFDFAKEIAYAVEKAAHIIGLNAVVAICNDGANLMLLHAMDDSYIASIQAAQNKAYTAVALKMPTEEALKESRGGSLDGLTNGDGILLLGGGLPLKDGGSVFGGIGVSGGSKEQDIMLAKVGEEYFKARLRFA